MSHVKRAREVFDVELAAVKAVRSRLTNSFDQAVKLIVDALAKRQKIVVLGVGKSGNIGRKIAATFTSTGSPAVLLDTVDAMHGDLGILNDGDILLALSYSGETDELINLLPAIKRFAVQIVAVTAASRSSLAKHAEVV
ncbi:MAG: SIS domain-containing protein, partial [Verrucomicrobiota bacterium]|nr:SIS domain-containing protein [Verrucomicrobiota bacterium]